MLQPEFDLAPTTVRIHRCKYVSRCKKPRCQERATLIAEKVDGAGRHVRQIEELGAFAQRFEFTSTVKLVVSSYTANPCVILCLLRTPSTPKTQEFRAAPPVR